MELTREQFKELMGLKDDDNGMEYADALHFEGQSYWEIAQSLIATMNFLLLNK